RGAPLTNTRAPRLNRSLGKSVITRHFRSPFTPWGASTCATTRNAGSDDVEIDADAFAGRGGFDEGSEAADDAALSADDFADVLLVDFQLVDRRVAILDLVHLHGSRLVDERACDVFDQPFQVGLELFEVLVVLELLVVLFLSLSRRASGLLS